MAYYAFPFEDFKGANDEKEIPHFTLKDTGFNTQFQKLFEAISDEGIIKEKIALQNLGNLAKDFQYAALQYGKIIISERNLPDEQKTIKPCNMGGKAGGIKYIVANILFKFAVDSENIYGSDEFAAKEAGHTLKGAIALFKCRAAELSLPLIMLIDFRGFRLVAMSVLPISPQTLRYGSRDGGKTVKFDKECDEIMGKVAKMLNLRKHLTGAPSNNDPKELFTPADIEMHKSDVDGRIYCVDFHRLFPPQPYDLKKISAESGKAPHLTRLLRPELVKQYSTPLSSDSFSRFNDWDIDMQSEKDVIDCYSELVSKKIPNYAEWLDREWSKQFHHHHTDQNRNKNQPPLVKPSDYRNEDTRMMYLSQLRGPGKTRNAVSEEWLDSVLRVDKSEVNSHSSTPSLPWNKPQRTPSNSSKRNRQPKSTRARKSGGVNAPSQSADRHRFVCPDTGVTFPSAVIHSMHAEGINCRFLGVIQSKVTHPALKHTLEVEMISRCIKVELNYRLRRCSETVSVAADQPYRACIKDFLNLVFGGGRRAKRYWEEVLLPARQMRFSPKITIPTVASLRRFPTRSTSFIRRRNNASSFSTTTTTTNNATSGRNSNNNNNNNNNDNSIRKCHSNSFSSPLSSSTTTTKPSPSPSMKTPHRTLSFNRAHSESVAYSPPPSDSFNNNNSSNNNEDYNNNNNDTTTDGTFHASASSPFLKSSYKKNSYSTNNITGSEQERSSTPLRNSINTKFDNSYGLFPLGNDNKNNMNNITNYPPLPPPSPFSSSSVASTTTPSNSSSYRTISNFGTSHSRMRSSTSSHSFKGSNINRSGASTPGSSEGRAFYLPTDELGNESGTSSPIGIITPPNESYDPRGPYASLFDDVSVHSGQSDSLKVERLLLSPPSHELTRQHSTTSFSSGYYPSSEYYGNYMNNGRSTPTSGSITGGGDSFSGTSTIPMGRATSSESITEMVGGLRTEVYGEYSYPTDSEDDENYYFNSAAYGSPCPETPAAKIADRDSPLETQAKAYWRTVNISPAPSMDDLQLQTSRQLHIRKTLDYGSDDVDRLELFYRSKKLTGVRISEYTMDELSGDFFCRKRPFEEIDIQGQCERVKQMPLLHYAEGTALFLTARGTVSQRERGRLAQLARRCFDKALALCSDDYMTLCNYAFFLEDQWGDLEGAKRMYKHALKANPYHVRSLYYLAMMNHYSFKEYNEAERLYKLALECHEEQGGVGHANCLKDYGNFLSNARKDNELAEIMYQKALEVDPSHPRALISYAGLLQRRGELTGAQALYRSAVTQNPNDPSCLFKFADFIWKNSRDPEAKADAKRKAKAALEVAKRNAKYQVPNQSWFCKRCHQLIDKMEGTDGGYKERRKDQNHMRNNFNNWIEEAELLALEFRLEEAHKRCLDCVEILEKFGPLSSNKPVKKRKERQKALLRCGQVLARCGPNALLKAESLFHQALWEEPNGREAHNAFISFLSEHRGSGAVEAFKESGGFGALMKTLDQIKQSNAGGSAHAGV